MKKAYGKGIAAVSLAAALALGCMGCSAETTVSDNPMPTESFVEKVEEEQIEAIEEIEASLEEEEAVIEEEVEAVEEVVEEIPVEPAPEPVYVEPAPVYTEPSYTPSYTGGTGVLNAYDGINWYNGNKETYYSSNVLYHYMTPQWTLREDGVWTDADGYVVVASSDLGYGSTVDTSLGMGKVYDSGCASGVVDVYTAW